MENKQEKSRKKQFQDQLEHIETMKNKCPIRIEDVNYLMDIGSRLMMTFEEMEKSRENWRNRAKEAEAQLK